MRIDLKKYLFLGLKSQQEDFFKRAQAFGKIQFGDPFEPHELPEISKWVQAILILKQLPEKTASDQPISPDDVITLFQTIEKERKLLQETQECDIFGELLQLDTPLIKQFFKGKRGGENPIYIGSKGETDYFFSLSEKKMSYPSLQEIHVDLKEKEALRYSLKKHEKELEEFASSLKYMDRRLNELLNDVSLNQAQDKAFEPLQGLFAVCGWMPEGEAFITDVYRVEIKAKEDEIAPTYLKNSGYGKVGEDLVKLYDTPSSTDSDPSYWVLASFALFFAFIIGDGGYGFLYLLLFLYLKWKMKPHRLIDLGIVLSSSCLIWGFLTHSFFGISFSLESPFRSFSLLNWLALKKIEFSQMPLSKELVDDVCTSILMELSLVVGVIHLVMGMLRYAKRNPPLIGWSVFLLGLLLYMPGYLGAPSFLQYALHFGSLEEAGLSMILAGSLIALLLSLLKHKWLGLLEVMNVIQIFSDILSYLRLYALVFAGAIMSITINQAAQMAPWFLGFFLLIIGHSVNMVLGIMGGVIHGLRLNFLEWYHYSFEGGGKEFNPLKLFKE